MPCGTATGPAGSVGGRLLTLDDVLLKSTQPTKSLAVVLESVLVLEAKTTEAARQVFLPLHRAWQLALYLLCPSLAALIHAMAVCL